MNKPRYSPRLTDAGRGIVKQAICKGSLRMMLTPTIRAVIKKECNCTDADIDKGIETGTIEWINEFKKMLAKQRAEMVPPPEKPYKHPGCKNHVTHPCEICGYQGDKNES